MPRDDKFNLTTFDGAKDKTEARRVQDLINPMSIRTRVVDNADGSQSIHRMRGGWPEVITTYPVADASADKATYIRGYISNIRSQTMNVLGTVWAAIIEKMGTWKKKEATTLFGPYTVSKISESAESGKDIWVIKQGILNVFRTSAKKTKQLAGTTDGVPLVVFPADQAYVAGTTDADDPHIFLIDNAVVRHTTWRNNAPTVEIYNSSELAAGSTGYPTGFVSGASIGLDTLTVGYAQTLFSNTGNVLHRARTITLKSAAPYYDLGTLVDHTTQGFFYIFPTGGVNTTVSPGVWKNQVPTLDTYIWDEYVKTGGPYPAQGALALVGYRHADPVLRTDYSSTSTTTYTGSNGYSLTKPVGWFGAHLTVDASVSVEARHTTDTSSGQTGMMCPVDIAYGGYGSTTTPPVTTHQWFGPDFFSPTVAAGTLIGSASQGSSVGKDWRSSSHAVASVAGATLLEMIYVVTGYSTSITGFNYRANGLHPFSGAAVNFADPNVNSYAAQWDAQVFCQTSATGDQYTPGYIMDQVAYNQNTGASTKTFSAETRDFILFDKINSRYVYLKGAFSGADSGSTVTLSIVISIDGVEFEQAIQSAASSSFSWLLPDEQVYQECRYWNPPSPFLGFTPPFCTQGGCRFVGYSEAHETGGSVFLWSIPLVLQQNPETDVAPSGGYVFNPRNFRAVLGLSSIALFAPFWSGLSNTIKIVNFADGSFTDWVKGVYPASANDSTTFSEVYRT